MKRRHALQLLASATLPASLLSQAHHGWSSFDLDRPIYLEGKASKVKWQSAHTEAVLELTPNIKLPADLARRSIPAQSATVDAPALLKKATLPNRKDNTWDIELAPIFRMDAWKVPEIKVGQSLSLLGFTFKDEKGSATLRAEFLWLDGKTYALRSSPA
jgi:hypothetical protein